MFRKYRFAIPNKQNSFITDGEHIYSAISRPGAGFSSDTRFFGQGTEKKFVVKRPKWHDQFDTFSQEKMKSIERSQERGYRNEQKIWNTVYPNNKAELFTKGGLRLVLPYLPGDTLTVSISRDPLTRYQQLLSVAYAVQKLYRLGFKYSDFNTDNVLIDKNPDNTFRAYLIDLNGMQSINDIGGLQELLILNILMPQSNINTHFTSIGALITELETKITDLTAEKNNAYRAGAI